MLRPLPAFNCEIHKRRHGDQNCGGLSNITCVYEPRFASGGTNSEKLVIIHDLRNLEFDPLAFTLNDERCPFQHCRTIRPCKVQGCTTIKSYADEEDLGAEAIECTAKATASIALATFASSSSIFGPSLGLATR